MLILLALHDVELLGVGNPSFRFVAWWMMVGLARCLYYMGGILKKEFSRGVLSRLDIGERID